MTKWNCPKCKAINPGLATNCHNCNLNAIQAFADIEEVVTLPIMDFTTGQETYITSKLEYFLRNPAGIKMEHLGLVMFNKARRQMGLSTYKFNKERGSFDEIPPNESN